MTFLARYNLCEATTLCFQTRYFTECFGLPTQSDLPTPRWNRFSHSKVTASLDVARVYKEVKEDAGDQGAGGGGRWHWELVLSKGN